MVVPKTLPKLIFDGDGSLFAGTIGCYLCGKVQHADDDPPSSFVRVRERIPTLTGFTTVEKAWFCPDCVARMFLHATRLGMWNQVSGVILAAIRRLLAKQVQKKRGKPDGYVMEPKLLETKS